MYEYILGNLICVVGYWKLKVGVALRSLTMADTHNKLSDDLTLNPLPALPLGTIYIRVK